MPKITKEDLQKQIEELNKKIAILKSHEDQMEETEKDMRHTFTVVLVGERYSSGPFGIKEEKDLSWMEIFTEIGKLLAARTFYNLDGNVSELECKMEAIEKYIKRKIRQEEGRDRCECEEEKCC